MGRDRGNSVRFGMKGLFITFEGIEGCGKSSQVALLKETLVAHGRRVIVTREPGGTRIAELVRRVLLDATNAEMTPATELLLYAAARAQHVDELIRPALESGADVISDRFADSTTAYQGAGRQLDNDTLAEIHRLATRGTWPDVTLVLDLPVEEGLARARTVGEPDRIEKESVEFHRRVRDGFLRIAAQEPERVHVIDAMQPVEAVAAAVWRVVQGRLP
jgi:dTMP kinase